MTSLETFLLQDLKKVLSFAKCSMLGIVKEKPTLFLLVASHQLRPPQ